MKCCLTMIMCWLDGFVTPVHKDNDDDSDDLQDVYIALKEESSKNC